MRATMMSVGGRGGLSGGFGRVALTRRSARPTRRGFTIIEIIVVVVIIGILAGFVAPRVFNRVGQSRSAVAKSNVATLASLMNQYVVDCGMPESGASLQILWEKPAGIADGKWKGPYVQNADDLKDPWGNDYVLVIPPQHNADFDVVSYGSDGQPGGEEEAADVVNGKK
jgi:general secretion pathway protein G